MEKYDVVIVGTGPGGLQAAKVLAENNKSVLILEKKQKNRKKDMYWYLGINRKNKTCRIAR